LQGAHGKALFYRAKIDTPPLDFNFVIRYTDQELFFCNIHLNLIPPPMSRTHLIAAISVVLSVFLSISAATGATAEPQTKQFIQIMPKQGKPDTKNSPLQLGIKEGKKGALFTVTFSGDKLTLEKGAQPAPPGGMYTILLDGNLVLQESFSGATLQTEKALPLQTAANGEHTLRCELHYAIGKTYQAELSFTFDAAPAVFLEKTDGKSNNVDPVLTLLFFNDGQENIGFLDVVVDERSLGVTQIAAQSNGEKKSLSQWMGKPVAIADLPQGKHLIKLTATSTSGTESVQYVPFHVETLPVLEVTKNKDGAMESIKASFQQANNAYSGSLDVFYQQGVILSLQTKEPALMIKKSDIAQAFTQHKLQLPTKPVTLVLCLRSANNTENWQPVVFLP
jgi:hypothetical protein